MGVPGREEMQDLTNETTKGLKAWSVRVRPSEAELILETIVRPAMAKNIELLVVRAEMVFGIDHLASALYHARRSMREGRNASDSVVMETLLYASGERQLSSAIKKMSVDDRTEEIVIARLNEGHFEPGTDWRELSAESESSSERLLRFGITEEELRTLKGRKPVELVLEKVAAVDISKK